MPYRKHVYPVAGLDFEHRNVPGRTERHDEFPEKWFVSRGLAAGERGETQQFRGRLNRMQRAFCRIGPVDAAAFRSPAELRGEFDAMLHGRSPGDVVRYCGSGVSTCHDMLAMTIAGYSLARLYPGSWSEWCADPKRPVARGQV